MCFKEWRECKEKEQVGKYLKQNKPDFLILVKNNLIQILVIHAKEIDIYVLKKICVNVNSSFVHNISQLVRFRCILTEKMDQKYMNMWYIHIVDYTQQ